MGAKVRFLGLLKDYQPESDENGIWYVPPGSTVQDIVDKSGVKSGKWEFIVTVNGESVRRHYELADGDDVIFSTIFLGG